MTPGDRPRVASRAVFIDRDGVIFRNRDDYIKSWAEVELLPGAVDAIVRLSQAGLRVVLLTNQSAIGRRIVSRQVVEDIHHRLGQIVVAAGGRIDAVLMCPHHPAAHCRCRKPQPGLLFEAETQMGIHLASSWLVGDQPSDIDAAVAAGCFPILVRPLNGSAAGDDLPIACPVFESLSGAAEFVLIASRRQTAALEASAP